MGSCGGFIGGDSRLIEYLRYTTPGFVYAAGLPPPNVGAALGALRVLKREPERIARLAANASLFLKLAQNAGWDSELLALEPDAKERFDALWLGYTESSGAPYLREAIAGIYTTASSDDVLVISSAEEGIFLVYHALLAVGDHVIVETPCYESGLELARSTGAEVSQWTRYFEDGWAHDLAALEALIRENTKMIYINTPSNPTGINMTPEVFTAVMNLAKERGIVVFCDEVYRELEHDPSTRLPAACDAYENAISLGSMSKSYGLPGLRLGWLASRNHRSPGTSRPWRRSWARTCSCAPPRV